MVNWKLPKADASCWYTYMVRCCDNTLYTGIAKDPAKRLAEHNTSRNGAKYTRCRRPVQLVFFEIQPTRSAAAKREHQIKKLPLAEKNHLIRYLYDQSP